MNAVVKYYRNKIEVKWKLLSMQSAIKLYI